MSCCRVKLIRWGRTKSGTVRWHCPVCGKTRTRQKVSFSSKLLSRYLIDGDTCEQLAETYNVSSKTINRKINKILDGEIPKLFHPEIKSPCWLMTDATHFKHWGCLFITKAVGIDQPLAITFHQKENYESAMEHLSSLDNLPVNGYTLDGRRGVVGAYKQLFPQAKFQRCQVHIRMKVQTLLTCKPKLNASHGLLKLVRRFKSIKSLLSAFIWWEDFDLWQRANWQLLHQRSFKGRSWWYTHEHLRSAWKHVQNAQDNLFVFLTTPGSVSHTNHLEGTFGQRKPALVRHRGLSRRRISSALIWTFYLKQKNS